MIADYEDQVRELQEKLNNMEDDLKRKDDEMNELLDQERSKSSAADTEKQQWSNMRLDLESKLTEAQNLNDAMREELDRLREEHAQETRQLRQDVEVSMANAGSGRADEELERENEELRAALNEQRQTTALVRKEAQEFLREMKQLSEQSGSSWAKQAELEKTIENLEQEVRHWRNRYTKTKTQLRGTRDSSTSLPSTNDASRYVRDKGFTDAAGIVKDLHVTKFQVAIDELLRRARVEPANTVIDAMKSVVMSVRRIAKDLDASPATSEQSLQQRKQLKGRVSSSANNLITASKTYAISAGVAPLSTVDAAASNLVTAMVELLRFVKIKVTPDGELDDDDDGTVTPVESAGFFSPRTAKSQSIQSAYQQDPYQQDPYPEDLPPPPPFQGLGQRLSGGSSAYSPLNSPRNPGDAYNPPANGNGNGYAPTSNGYESHQADANTEALKVSKYVPL